MPSALSRARLRLPGVPVPLRLILAVALLEAVCWVSFAPPLQGPDEPAHFAYAQHFAEIGHPPTKYFPETGAGSQSTQHGTFESWFNLRTTLGQPGARPLWYDADEERWEEIQKNLPPLAREDGYGPNAVAQNPPGYYVYQSVPYLATGGADDLRSTLFWMRVWGGMLFVGTVLFTWLAAGELFRRRRLLQTIAAGAVLLLPQLAYMGSVLNPDTALATIWSAFVWLAIRALRRGPEPATVLALGLVVGLSVVTQGRGLPLVVPGALALALTYWRHRRWDVPALAAGAGAVVIVGVALAWAFHITTQTSGPEAGAAFGGEARFVAGGFSVAQFLSYIWQFYFPKLPFMDVKIGPDYGFSEVYVQSFYGRMGSLEIQFPTWVYDWLHVAVLAGVVALIAALWVKRSSVRRSWDVVLVLGAMFVSLLFVLHFVAYRGMLGHPGDPVLIGRYVLPLVALWALGIAAVAAALPRRWAVVFGGGVLTVGALLQVTGLGLTLTRFYG